MVAASPAALGCRAWASAGGTGTMEFDKFAIGFDLRAEALVLGTQRIELQQVLQRDCGKAGNRA